MQVSQEADQVVWYSHLFQNFPQFIVIHRVRGFGIVSKAEIDVFLELSCFLISTASRADDITVMAESEEELLSLLMRVKEESEKADLKLVRKTKTVASGPITSWQIHGEKVETLTDFIFMGFRITVDSDCSREIKDTCSLEGKLW